MSEIVQQLGFDASAALAQLDKLDKALDKFSKSLTDNAAALKKFNSSSGTAAKAMSKLSGGATQVGKSFAVNMRSATADVGRLHTSLKLLSRVVFTQAIVRALSQMRRSFEETALAAIKFQDSISLITTIDDSGTSFNHLADQVRRLSDSFNIPLADAAAGVYQSLSNQVGSLSESLDFAASSAQFAKATNSSLADSVDLLSGALKAYQLDVSQTDRVASVLFKTIDRGRITADELANTFGRIGALSKETGLSLEELNAGLAAISVRGVGTSEAITGLRAIVSSFLKPSVAMRNELERLGFLSGSAALQSLGLERALRAMSEAAGGSTSKLASLFPNVRALASFTALAGDNFKELATDIREMDKAGTDFAKSAWLKTQQTEAAKLASEMNKLSNAMTVDLGQSLLRAGVQISDLVGGVDNLVNIVRYGDKAIVAATGSLLLFKGAMTATRNEAAFAATALGRMAGVMAAFAAGNIIGQAADNFITTNAELAVRGLERLHARELAAFEERQTNKLHLSQQLLKNEIKLINDRNRLFQKAYVADVVNIRVANSAMVESTTSAFQRIVDARQQLTDRLGDLVATNRSISSGSQDRVTGLNALLDQRAFDRATRGADEESRAVQQLGRAFKLAEGAATQLRKATDPKQVADALSKFGEADRLAETAEQIASRTNNRDLEARAAGTLNKITQEQLAAERELQRLSERRAEQAESARASNQKVTDQLREQVALLLNSVSQFDASGNRIPDNPEQRAAALKKISELALSNKDLDSLGLLGLSDFITKNLANLQPVDLQFNTESAVQKIKSDLTAAFADFKLSVNVAPLEAALGRAFADPEDFQKGLAEATDKVAQLEAEISKSDTNAKKVANLRTELDALFRTVEQPDSALQRLDNATRGKLAFVDEETRNALFKLREFQQELQTLGESSNITASRVQEVFGRLDEFQRSLGFVDTRLFAADLNLLAQAVGKINQIGQLQTPGTEKLRTEVQRINSAIDAAQFSAAAFANQMERAAAAASRITLPSAAQGFAKGGFVQHFARGGMARGMDTVPVMARQGEFFVNPKSTQKFFSQLQAINAGQQPVYRQQGGGVTIGDTTINVSGAESPKATAAAVRGEWNRIKREARRGTI